jgi:Asp/Glu/hydantoin racemase
MKDGPRIAIVHAVHEAIAPMAEAFARAWPRAETFNLVDDSLSVDVARDGGITPAMTRRFVTLTRYAASTGARAVQFTCSAFNACIEEARTSVDIPVLKPDEAMIENALTYGPRLGVVVTFGPSIASITEQVSSRAVAMGVLPQLDVRLAQGALDALRGGDADTHDRLIAEAAAGLHDCDVVMLGQYSMARAASAVTIRGGVPVLTGPRAAVDRLRQLLD